MQIDQDYYGILLLRMEGCIILTTFAIAVNDTKITQYTLILGFHWDFLKNII